MKKIKNLLLILSLLMVLPVHSAINLDDITSPLEPFYRFGTTDTPENQIDVTSKIDISPTHNKEEKMDSEGLTYADLSIKKMSLEISKTLEC